MTSQPARRGLKYYLIHIAASEVWVILGALLIIFSAATHYYGKQVILGFLGSPHLSPVILMGVAVWFVGMMLQSKFLSCNKDQPGQRQSNNLWVPIKAGLLTALLLPLPGLNGAVITLLLSKWVECIA